MPDNLTFHQSSVSPAERIARLGQEPVTVWLTGLSGSGKSTIAYGLEKRLLDAGRIAYVLDGDNIRQGLSNNLGFSAPDRTENIRRVAEVAALMNDAGLIVVTAFISPLRSDRAMARSVIGDKFLEVHIAAPLSVCEARDPKGLYRRARHGEIENFTGISAPYEVPEHPDVIVATDLLSIDQACDRLFSAIAGENRVVAA
jgi:adenylylsulfate kinase